MTEIADGVRYDIGTARLVKSRSDMDDCWSAESLFLNRAGEYFLLGFANIGWFGSEYLVPLSIEEAREWAHKYMDADEYKAEFGERPE